jgi:hypothetical protein
MRIISESKGAKHARGIELAKNYVGYVKRGKEGPGGLF